MIPLSYYVTLSAVVFFTGLVGVLIRRNIIIILLSVELMLNAVNINMIAFAVPASGETHDQCRRISADEMVR